MPLQAEAEAVAAQRARPLQIFFIPVPKIGGGAAAVAVVDGGLRRLRDQNVKQKTQTEAGASDAALTRMSRLRWRSKIPQLLASLCWSPLFCQTLIAKPTRNGSAAVSCRVSPLVERVATIGMSQWDTAAPCIEGDDSDSENRRRGRRVPPPRPRQHNAVSDARSSSAIMRSWLRCHAKSKSCALCKPLKLSH